MLNPDELGVDTLLDDSPAQPAAKTNLNSKRQLLEELRLKQNACRKRNHQQVVEEDRRVNSPAAKRAAAAPATSRGEQGEKGEKDEDEDDNYLLHMTADQAEAVERRKHRKKKGTFGWEMFNEEAHHNSYKRQLKSLSQAVPGGPGSASTAKVDGAGLPLQEHPDESLYGKAHTPAPQALDRMVGELEKAEERRARFSRRRETNPSGDVSYINERNKIFNRKIARAFDPYTTEIRQNLERGTAL